jgi:hypothetical protein
MAENIMQIFNKMVSSGEEINLLNTYKGVPLAHSARITNVGFSTIQVSTDTCQTVSMYIEKKTYIQSPKICGIYRADVENIENAEMTTTLGSFSAVDFRIGARSEVRVQPADPISVHLSDQTGLCSLNGQISDISQDGLGIYLSWMTMIPRFFPVGAPVFITFQLPGVFSKIQTKPLGGKETGPLDRFATEKTRFSTTTSRDYRSGFSSNNTQTSSQFINPTIEAQAEVANIYQEQVFNRFRIGLHVKNNAQQGHIISKYIGQRQTEIIQEIREKYLLMKQSHEPASL